MIDSNMFCDSYKKTSWNLKHLIMLSPIIAMITKLFDIENEIDVCDIEASNVFQFVSHMFL